MVTMNGIMEPENKGFSHQITKRLVRRKSNGYTQEKSGSSLSHMLTNALQMAVIAFALVMATATPVMAAGGSILATTAIDSSLGTFLTLVEAVISGLGEVVTLWGISEWGISFMSSEGTMQANALKRVVGGLVMMLAPQILSLLSAT